MHKHGYKAKDGTAVEGRGPCTFKTKKECDDTYADWQAMQQVLLAYSIVMQGRAKDYKKDKGQLAQLVRYIAGEQEDILNAEGNPSEAPWAARLRAAVARVVAADLPGYTLYTPGRPPAPQE